MAVSGIDRPLVLVLACAIGLSGCGDDSAAPSRRGPRPFPVEIATVESRTVEYSITGIGSVEPFEQVQVTARVAGVVETVHFREGQEVKEGQELAAIEPDRFRIALQSARASLARAQAAQNEARSLLARREELEKTTPGMVSIEEMETFRTKVATTAAEVAAARAATSRAQIDVRDAHVRAPIAGVIQTRTVQTGTYAQPGTVLATLVRRDPLMLRFDVAEADARQVQVGEKVRFQVRGKGDELTAVVRHVAAVASEKTRLVEVRAEIDDPRAAELQAGAFADVTVPIDDRAAPVIPMTAVRPSEKGFLAYVVDGEIARERVLTLGLRTADGKVEVKDGLKAGERLVVRGAEALRDGAPVRVVEKGSPGDGGTAP